MVLSDHKFHPLPCDVLPGGGDYYLLDPVGDLEEPILIELANIPCPEPAVDEGLLCELRLLSLFSSYFFDKMKMIANKVKLLSSRANRR